MLTSSEDLYRGIWIRFVAEEHEKWATQSKQELQFAKEKEEDTVCGSLLCALHRSGVGSADWKSSNHIQHPVSIQWAANADVRLSCSIAPQAHLVFD